MRHGKKVNHLSRTDSHRRAMLSNMATSLILHKRISTTLAKAKALRGYVEPLLTKSKNDTTHSRRIVFSYLQDKDAVTILFREIAEKIASRPGGYTRIIKMENRLGDNAEMALIELVDYNTVYSSDVVKPEKKSTRRRGGSAKGKVVTAPAASADVTPADDAVVLEPPVKEGSLGETPLNEMEIETPGSQHPAEEPDVTSAPPANEENAEKGE